MTSTRVHWTTASPLTLRVFIGLVMAMAATVAVYWPSLSGAFVFDDAPNILGNPSVHLTALDWSSLKQAATGTVSDALPRPLAMLSFGIDWYFSAGPDPWRMKAENLGIHLFNGLALFGLLRAVLRKAKTPNVDTLALIVTAAWLLAPINFTGVAYIVQRMESLCQVFVLCGLWGYVAARERMQAGAPGLAAAAVSLVAGTGLGVLSKESAALLPLYAFATEICLFRFRNHNDQRDHRVAALFVFLLVLPGLAASVIAVLRFATPDAYSIRSFSLSDRLLTEPRILMHYIGWTLLPNPRALALYHDDIAISRSLLGPWTTLASILALFTLFITAILIRRRRPLIALGIFWFLSAHLITGTFIPLEMTFEHRNYFASVGVLLAVLSCLIPNTSTPRLPHARQFATFGLLTLFGFTTLARALEWSNLLSFAMAEAQKNPNSARATYELARTYVIVSRYDIDSPAIPLAYSTLDHAANMPSASILPDQGLLMLDSRLGKATSPDVWNRMRDKLRKNPLSAENKWALYSLSECAIAKRCPLPPAEMIATFNTALARTPVDAGVLAIFANYALSALNDVDLAIRTTRDAVDIARNNLLLRGNLIVLLISNNQKAEAREVLKETFDTLPRAKSDPFFMSLQEELTSQSH